MKNKDLTKIIYAKNGYLIKSFNNRSEKGFLRLVNGKMINEDGNNKQYISLI